MKSLLARNTPVSKEMFSKSPNYSAGVVSGFVSGFVSVTIWFATINLVNPLFLGGGVYLSASEFFDLLIYLLFGIIPGPILGITYAFFYDRVPPKKNAIIKSLVLSSVYFLPLSLWAGGWSVPSAVSELTNLLPFYVLFSVLLGLTFPNWNKIVDSMITLTAPFR